MVARRHTWLAAAAVTAAMVVVGSATARVGPDEAPPGAGPPPNAGPPQLVLEKDLGNGTVKRVYSNGVTFVGRPAARLVFEEDAEGNTVSVGTGMPGPASEEGIRRAAEAYARAGRSERQDAINAGIPNPEQFDDNSGARLFYTPNEVWDSWCVNIDTTNVHWYGCIRRKGTSDSDPNAYYLADTSKASGWAKDPSFWYDNWLDRGWVKQDYPDYRRIVDWEPATDRYAGSCHNTSFSFSRFGATLSRTWTNCPERTHPEVYPTVFKTSWQGCTGSGNTRMAAEGAFVRVPNGYSSYVYFAIGAHWENNRFCL